MRVLFAKTNKISLSANRPLLYLKSQAIIFKTFLALLARVGNFSDFEVKRCDVCKF